MAPLSITVDIPAKIAVGLANGTLIRNGGVIQDTSGRVVMWLKESGTVKPNPNMLAFPMASSMLTLGLSVIGLAAIYSKLNALEKRLKQIQEVIEKINEKIDLSFYANFRAALELAQNAFTMTESNKGSIFTNG